MSNGRKPSRPPSRYARFKRRERTPLAGTPREKQSASSRMPTPLSGATAPEGAGVSANGSWRERLFSVPLLRRPTKADLFPAGMWRALWFGFQAWFIPWLLLVLCCLMVWMPTSTTPAQKSTTWVDPLVVANSIYAAAFGASLHLETISFSLTPWGLTLLIMLLLKVCLQAAKTTNAFALGWGVAGFLLPTFVSLGVAGRYLQIWLGFVIVVFLSLVVCFAAARRASWWIPSGAENSLPWLALSLRLLRFLSLAALLLSLVTLLVTAIFGWSQMVTIWKSLHPGIIGSIALVLGILAYLPTMLVWTLSWLIGPGITLGDSTIFSPGQVIGGELPPIPMLAWLPDTPVGWWPIALPILAAFAAGLILSSRHEVALPDTLLALALVAAGLLLGGLAIIWATSGNLGAGRLVNVGPTRPVLYAGVLSWGIPFAVGVVSRHRQVLGAARRFAAHISGKSPYDQPTAKLEI